ncbi:hypothetical protein EV03_0082 [Prochlorococcus marinus str. PAC1]|uniref:Uncharacterized protein n=1 Tax=Prochlorococcus marinus str. PAC1 TaxID=59924 RepID=A0A0A2CA53_PROMR|nr:hypothetical protein EV03_0082 [Prochlorococcus marinus str. PAC1]
MTSTKSPDTSTSTKLNNEFKFSLWELIGCILFDLYARF